MFDNVIERTYFSGVNKFHEDESRELRLSSPERAESYDSLVQREQNYGSLVQREQRVTAV